MELKTYCSCSRNRFGTGLTLALALFGVAVTSEAQTKATAASQVTFTKDVAPILQKACQSCHRTGSIAPMSLLTYQESRPWAKSIKEKVVKRDMPPWYIDKTVGVQHFSNDISLSDQEIATIVKWVDAGSPEGNPADMPKSLAFDDNSKWHIGNPDIVVKLQKAVVVPAKYPDQWLSIPMEPLNLKEDRYIKAVEIKPISGVVDVHHADASMQRGGENLQMGDDGEGGGFLEEYAVGKFGDIFPDGSGRLLAKDTRLGMSLHVHANTKTEETVQLAVGLVLYPAGYKPQHIEVTAHVGDSYDLDIPQNTIGGRVDGYSVMPEPTVLTRFQPHLHNRGLAECLEAIYPHSAGSRVSAARVETISCVDRYHFDWHVVYNYSEDEQPLLPAGTILHVISWYDNTSGNKYNPDATNWIGWGHRTIDDMSFVWESWYTVSQQEFDKRVAERKSKLEAAHPRIKPAVDQATSAGGGN